MAAGTVQHTEPVISKEQMKMKNHTLPGATLQEAATSHREDSVVPQMPRASQRHDKNGNEGAGNVGNTTKYASSQGEGEIGLSILSFLKLLMNP